VPFRAGDTFLNREAPSTPTHLWIVMSDPEKRADQIVIVNVTSWREGADPSCRLSAGDHPFVRHDSYVNYDDSKIVSQQVLENLESRGLITRHQDVNGRLLAKVREGAGASAFLSLAKRQILEDQGLL
jgi:hypothetical protein